MAETYGRLREYVAENDDYRLAADVLSYMLIDLGVSDDELDDMESARDHAQARCRHAALRSLLEGTIGAMGHTRFAGEQDALRERVAALLHDGALPLRFPDSEWESCRKLAEDFRSGILEPAPHELALREASRRYAEDPSAANRDALHAAASADRADDASTEPAAATLDEIAACLDGLVERFHSVADRKSAADDSDDAEAADVDPPDPESALRAENAALKAANREAEERIASLKQALGDAAGENDGCAGTGTAYSSASPPSTAASLRLWTTQSRMTDRCRRWRATRTFPPGRSGISRDGWRSPDARRERSGAPPSRTSL